MFSPDDTIAAVSTAGGSADRAIVRLSGPASFQIATGVFHPPGGAVAEMRGFSACDGLIALAGLGVQLPARLYLFRAPRSYTRQDVVELHVPGNPCVAAAIMDELVARGARLAQPGEFTARAFFSGRLDLSAAEAVADIIDADDDARLRSAVATLKGELFRLCRTHADAIAEALATVEASIDLADEDIRLASPADLADQLAAVSRELAAVASRAGEMPETSAQPRAVLAGLPNVGKSSLLNALSGVDRAIVSAMAGTTRDVLEAPVDLGEGTSAILQDAAGFGPWRDPLSAAAHEAARQAVRSADAILLVVDASQPDRAADLELLAEIEAWNRRSPLMVVANKIDLASPCLGVSASSEFLPLSASPRLRVSASSSGVSASLFRVSARTGQGLPELRAALRQCLNLHAGRSGDAIGLHQRQKRCLLSAAAAAARAATLLKDAAEVADQAELVAVELRSALSGLGQISGQVVTEDILGRIFARFCVGK